MASQAGRVAAPPADPRLVMPANVSAWAQSGFQAYVRGAKPPWLRRGLRITRVFPCVARGLRTCASFMFASCRWRRSLAADGHSGAFQGHALVVRRPGSPVDRRALRTTVRFSGRTYPLLARILRASCAVAGRCCLPLAAAVAVTVAVSRVRCLSVASGRVCRARAPHLSTLARVLARRPSPPSD